jgi:hypothetical protein
MQAFYTKMQIRKHLNTFLSVSGSLIFSDAK